ncbi:PREDICTED: LOW QUALITY PROTEIN: VQ motif-containing protein 9 [Tarenaya hassleriana]|uniref:LOW QUALITY PROTEIN: VQ motif-containing protein 9 n=1 Tax=Tarenaya hassleriana TaxID=28532 RepID=UPI00053C0CE9|nr:PREDICTED: LOW QUALITY PROTEIN: VQ motif-containing protein 9 [Tarenaya hassleriana]
MDKSCSASGDSSAASYTGNRDSYLRQLNKLSHKISKPTSITTVKHPGFDPNPNNCVPSPPPASNHGNLLHHHQPPVYNINKNDFRDVVQRLTGSPSHERISSPPPIHQPKPQSSRLQRIRPPPLAHLSNRPLNPAIPMTSAISAAPLSPLPPLPPSRELNSVSTVDSNPKQLSGFSPLAPLFSPRRYQQQENAPPERAATSSSVPAPPPPLGCMSSPKSHYGLFSPSIPLSPTPGQLGLPLSPTTVPVPSPGYKGR